MLRQANVDCAGRGDTTPMSSEPDPTESAIEAAALAWMFHFAIAGGAGWTFFAVGIVLAAVYNLLTCDWIAEKLQ